MTRESIQIMNYGNIKECDIADGPGVRVSLFVSGCRHHCKGCFNEETWDFGFGQHYTEETEAEILRLLGAGLYDLSKVSEYAKVDNSTFKLMKRNLPGAFTFILNGTTRLPKIFRNRKEVGIRMPDNSIIQEIARLLDAPIMTTTLPHEDNEDIEYCTDPELIDEKFGDIVDLVIDGGIGGTEGSTVVDCTNGEPEIIRQGLGWLDEG